MSMTDELHALWRAAGGPTTREVAAKAGCSHSTVAMALSGRRLPARDIFLRIVETLDGDGERFDRHYDHVSALAKAKRPVRPLARGTNDLLTDVLEELKAIRVLLQRQASASSPRKESARTVGSPRDGGHR